MQAEIGKMVVLSNDSVIPTTFQVPRRSYLDFHNDLYPAQTVYQCPAQDGDSWLQGSNEVPDIVVPQPGSSWGVGAGGRAKTPDVKLDAPKSSQHTQSSQTADTSKATITPSPAPVQQEAPQLQPPVQKLAEMQIPRNSDSAPSPQEHALPSPVAEKVEPEPPKATSAPERLAASGPSKTEKTEQPPKVATKTNTPKPASATHWSRTFLGGKTALKPEYDDVHGVATTMGAAVQLLKSNTEYLFYPMSGPGGRLAVHALSDKGRLPTHPPTLACGSDIVDFVLDPFDARTVYIACSDAKIRIFNVPDTLDGDFGEPNAVLGGKISRPN
jgi:coronin-7